MVQQAKVSEEYLDTICDWLEEWVEKPTSMAIPQFLSHRGIGWGFFKQFLDMSPKLQNTFEVVVCELHSRWIDYAFSKKELSRHIHSILMRYLRVYDPHAFDLELMAKKEVAESSNLTLIKYESENYSSSDLQGVFKQKYEDNANKRRSRKKAK